MNTAERFCVGQLRAELFDFRKGICQGCGWAYPHPRCFHSDHLLAESKEGPDDRFNRELLCHMCNAFKGNRLTLDETRALNVARGFANPDHPAYAAWAQLPPLARIPPVARRRKSLLLLLEQHGREPICAGCLFVPKHNFMLTSYSKLNGKNKDRFEQDPGFIGEDGMGCVFCAPCRNARKIYDGKDLATMLANAHRRFPDRLLHPDIDPEPEARGSIHDGSATFGWGQDRTPAPSLDEFTPQP